MRAGFHSAKKITQLPKENGNVYLLKNPQPIQSPIQHQSFNDRDSMACQPATIVSTQKSTFNGSIVIRIDPTDNNGAASTDKINAKAALRFTSLAINLNNTSDKRPAIKGEKKRTPNAESPQIEVPSHCV